MVALIADPPSLGFSSEKHKIVLKSQMVDNVAPDSPEKSDTSVASETESPALPVVDVQKAKVRAQQDAFDKYVKQKATEQNVAEDAETSSQKRAADENTRLIHRAREYQQELFERAKDENIIAVLDTGSGKTLISCLLIKHTLEKEIVGRAQGKLQRIPVFLANSVHLVLQQARVLANNLVTPPVVFVGGNAAEPWKRREYWSRLFDQSITVVCTPAILQQCLDGALINIQQISLLVFDEAHHAKKNHPYSMIIRSHYLKYPPDDRPRIFGMTASPVDSKGNIDVNTAELEQILDSKIVTTSDLSILSFAPKPIDVAWRYPKLRPAFETDLYRQLWQLCSFAAELKKGFEFAKKAVSELGPWCADYVWKYILGGSDHESEGIIRKHEQSKAYNRLDTEEERKSALEKLQEACKLIRQYDFEGLTPEFFNLSSKVLFLYEQLKVRYEAHPNTRTIVFLEQRLTALMLNECFKRLSIPDLHTDVLLGTAMESTSLKNQEKVLDKFRTGAVNLIFATSVADEGIDIPQCNLCVRFDLYKTPIQYTQSRGRARMTDSTYAHMIQEDDQAQEHLMRYVMDSDTYIKQFCQNLPPNRLLGQGTKLERLIIRDSANRKFKTATGAVCDFGNSLMILSRFVPSLNCPGALKKETYEEEIDLETKQFRCVVKIPPNSEVQVKGARGDWRQNKQLAKRSAAFNCCYLLRHKGFLNEDLCSIFRKLKPENLNAHLAVSAKKTTYPMQSKPKLWSKGIGEVPDVLFACILRFRSEQELRKPLSPLVMLTRHRLPIMPSFPLYLEDNVRTDVMLEFVDQGFRVKAEDLTALSKFTLNGVFGDVFNKKYQLDDSRISYWLAPPLNTSATTLSSLVDMDAVRLADLGRIKWTVGDQADGVWTNKFIYDPRSGKHHYFTDSIVKGASIFDSIPKFVPDKFKKNKKNIIDFSDNSWRASKKHNRTQALYDPVQPVLAAKLLLTRRNFLDRAVGDERALIDCQIAPQTLEVSRLASAVAASCFVWPSIIHRIESYMITLEAFEQLDLTGVPADLALEAFSKDGDMDEENGQHHFAAERGMGKNYERLEFIGDSLLKMMTTITVFNRTTENEEAMHCRRMAILCNRRLFDVSTEKHELYRFARTTAFNTNTWYPESLILLEGRGAKKCPEPVKHAEVSQDLGMKTIADISEAVIGAAVAASHGLPNPFDLGIKAITLLVDSEDHAINSWAEIAPMYKPPDWSLLQDDVQANKLAKDVEARTGYRFQYPRLLRSAFTHSSDTNSTVPDLQRLEFLGDAVLDWVCIRWLFDSNPDRNPQWLTEHKMAMVSNKFLAALAVVLDFDKFMYCTTTKLYADITDYARKVREMRSHIDVTPDFWTKFDAPPKALSDVVESYLGALLVDSNWDYQEIEKFFNKHVLWFFEDISQYDSFANRHPTSYLYKKLNDEYRCQNFVVRGREIGNGESEPNVLAVVMVHGHVIAESQGSSAKYAKVRASKRALQKLEGMSPEEFRRKYGCNCREKANVLDEEAAATIEG